eukprot:5990838-Pyramimonas_sp.AAC.1
MVGPRFSVQAKASQSLGQGSTHPRLTSYPRKATHKPPRKVAVTSRERPASLRCSSGGQAFLQTNTP